MDTSHGSPLKRKNFPRWLKLSFISFIMLGGVALLSFILYVTAENRNQLDSELTDQTSYNVGGAVSQEAPLLGALSSDSIVYRAMDEELNQSTGSGMTASVAEEYVENTSLVSTDANVLINLELKKRGLRYEPTYTTEFAASYILTNTSDKKVAVAFEFPFPSSLYDREISNAVLKVNGVEVEKPVRRADVADTSRCLDETSAYISEYYNPGSDCYGDTSSKSSLYWEGTIVAQGTSTIEVEYTTVGIGEFTYTGIENPEGSQDFTFVMTVLGTRKYDNVGSLSYDSREYIKQDGKNGVVLTWDKPDLFSNPGIGITIAPRVNPASQLADIYKIMIPLYIGFSAAVILMVTLLKKEFGGVDMIILSSLFAIFFPFLHYLVSFNVDPSMDVLAGYSGVIDFSMPLYGAFAIALGLVGGLMLYLFARVSGGKFALGVGLPLLVVFMAFFPLAMTLPEYKYLLALVGVVALLAVVVQMRANRKITNGLD